MYLLLPKALKLIEKYKEHFGVFADIKLFPFISNQRVLKELAILSGIV
jgi:hypothetical protein